MTDMRYSSKYPIPLFQSQKNTSAPWSVSKEALALAKSAFAHQTPTIIPSYLSRPFDRRVAIEAVRETLELLNIPTIAKDRIDYVIGPKGDTDEEFWVRPCLSPYLSKIVFANKANDAIDL